MKLPSIDFLLRSLGEILLRFPFVLLSAGIGTAMGMVLIDRPDDHLQFTLIRLLMVGSLGVPLFFAVHILCEKIKPAALFRFFSFALALIVLVQFYFSVYDFTIIDKHEIIYRYFFWSASLHLLVAFCAFFVYEEINGFWQYNKVLFLRFLTAVLYSSVLFLGLAGAILAVQTLFNINLQDEIYARLWVFIAGMFNTAFFLGGIPKPIEKLNTETDYPKGLKIFTQYVLISLVSIYLIILYAYTAKILVQMSLPKGWVANLILGFSVSGIFSLLLIYPIRELEENKWIKAFSRFYYFSLLPLVVLLFVAIGFRISEYGVTVERYIVAMLGVWLAVITLYFVFSKQKNIIFIPLTLTLFLLGSLIGPWGMFQTSERSQLKRLQSLLQKNNAFQNGKVIPLSADAVEKIKVRDINQINSIIEYIGRNHGYEKMTALLPDSCAHAIQKDTSSYNKDYEIQKCIGLYGAANYRSEDNEDEINLSFYCQQYQNLEELEITGYDRLYEFNSYNYDSPQTNIDSTKAGYSFLQNNRLSFFNYGNLMFNIDLDSISNRLKHLPRKQKYSVDVTEKEMSCELLNSKNQQVKLMFRSLQLRVTDTSQYVQSLNGYMLVKK